jgi:DNA-binding XRE family transcriptional regulator
MSPEQILELQRRLKKDREIQKKVGLKLRKEGKTQEEVASIVGVTQKTISNWEKGEDISFSKFTNTYNPRDKAISNWEKGEDISFAKFCNTYNPQTISNWEKGEDISFGKFTNTYNPRDSRIKITREQKQDTPASWGKMTVTKVTRLQNTVRKVRRVRNVRNAILPGLGLLKKMTVCMSLLGLLKKMTVCISIKVWMPKG